MSSSENKTALPEFFSMNGSATAMQRACSTNLCLCAMVMPATYSPALMASMSFVGVLELTCYQEEEEADTRMVLHAAHAAANVCPAVLLMLL